MGKSIRLQNRRKQVQNESAYVGGMCVLCMCVRVCVCACIHGVLPVCVYACDWVRVHFSVWGKLWQPGVFVLKFRQGSRWLLSVWLSKLASCREELHRLSWCHWYCSIKANPSYRLSHSKPMVYFNQKGEQYVTKRGFKLSLFMLL